MNITGSDAPPCVQNEQRALLLFKCASYVLGSISISTQIAGIVAVQRSQEKILQMKEKISTMAYMAAEALMNFIFAIVLTPFVYAPGFGFAFLGLASWMGMPSQVQAFGLGCSPPLIHTKDVILFNMYDSYLAILLTAAFFACEFVFIMGCLCVKYRYKFCGHPPILSIDTKNNRKKLWKQIYVQMTVSFATHVLPIVAMAMSSYVYSWLTFYFVGVATLLLMCYGAFSTASVILPRYRYRSIFFFCCSKKQNVNAVSPILNSRKDARSSLY
ncbi:unnamed protein product [Caenorhabditis auriculariae]|uniref:Uncharacterized protein n=1 Tax=Caenorhabditis auriculariae TaxID=2777116 RepID=A0A8S1HEQ6_9PELO|nr:unnamed protein product [Caenorhabditis auriculariae]